MRPGVRLGVDVGSVRVGIATSDAEGVLATPVGTKARADTDHEQSVADLVAEREAIEVVVGLPRSLSGEEGAAAQEARSYAAALAARVPGVAVRLVDERLTTVDAHRALHASGRAGRRHREVVDQVAAVLILQAALDAERASGRPPGEQIGGRKPRRRKRAEP